MPPITRRGANACRALQFNGTDGYVLLPGPLAAGAGFGMAFWMKTGSAGGTGGNNWFNGAGLVDGEVAGVTNDFGVTLLNGKIAFGVGNLDTTLQSTHFRQRRPMASSRPSLTATAWMA